MDKFRQSFDIDTTASLGANPRRHRELERSARWNLNADLLVLHQVVFRSFTYSKFIKRRKQQDIFSLFGMIDYDEGYNYKRERMSKRA
jgi:hypothetical protein